MNQKNEKFSYTYSAKQQEEINNIMQKYIPPAENKMEQLKRLDAGVTKKGTMAGIILGVISSLIFGIGMCCTMVWTDYFVPGIIIGIVGMIGIGLAYPAYCYITKKQREKIAPEIIRLSNELMASQSSCD